MQLYCVIELEELYKNIQKKQYDPKTRKKGNSFDMFTGEEE